MNQDQTEPTLEESLRQVMRTLPPPIRRYLSERKYSVVAKNLMNKYDLHLDQGGILEREIMLLLMGTENPDEFAESLKNEAAISEDIVQNIMVDVNQEIFIPLQREVRNAGGGGQRETIPEPRISAPVQRPQTSPPSLSGSAPLPPKAAMPFPDTTFEKMNMSAPPAMLPLGEDQDERMAGTTPRPFAQPPADLPGAMPGRNIPGARLPLDTRVTGSPPPQPRVVPPAKPYTVDPYREPTEEFPQ